MRHSAQSALRLFTNRLRERSALGVEQVDAILALPGRLHEYEPRTDVVRLGETTNQACLIVDGLVGRFGQVIDGRRQITAVHIPGDMCDLHSVVIPRVSWALQTLSPSAILRIPHRALRELAHGSPAIAEAFWRDCSVDASVLSQWVVNVGRRDALSRVAHLLCELAVRMNSVGLGSHMGYRLEATQAQVGDATGLTAVHVNRVYATLRDAGAVEIKGREVRILDWERLVEIADFDDDYLHLERLRGREPAA